VVFSHCNDVMCFLPHQLLIQFKDYLFVFLDTEPVFVRINRHELCQYIYQIKLHLFKKLSYNKCLEEIHKQQMMKRLLKSIRKNEENFKNNLKIFKKNLKVTNKKKTVLMKKFVKLK